VIIRGASCAKGEIMRLSFLVAACCTLLSLASPAHASDLTFTATLSGEEFPTTTGSAASGAVTLRIDPDLQTIDANVTVLGLRIHDLAAHLVHRAMGPAHLHRYTPDGDVALIVPFPLEAGYAETEDGFTISMRGYAYAAATAAVRSELNFEAFLAAMATDPIYFTIHTNAHPDGEISGRVTRME
jgi:hypothetical protein